MDEENWFDAVHFFNPVKMSSIKPPKPLVVNSDIDMSQEWTEWWEIVIDMIVILSQINCLKKQRLSEWRISKRA